MRHHLTRVSRLSVFLFLGYVCLGMIPITVSRAATVSERADAAISSLKAENGDVRSVPQAMKDSGLPGLSVAVIENYEVLWSRSWGVRAVAGEDLIEEETVFNLASISKPITAVLVAVLAEKGLIELDVPVAGYLKRWKLPNSEFTNQVDITLAHLLSHTAGTTQGGFDDFYLGGEVPTLADVLDGSPLAGTDPLEFTSLPGSNWSYSGGGYVIVQMAVEDYLGQSLADLAEQHLFGPLGMIRTTMRQHGESGFPTNVALAHDSHQEQVGATGLPICPQLSASGVWSTPVDLAKLVIGMQKALRGDQGGVISPAVARWTTDIVTSRVMGGWSHGWSREYYYGNLDWFGHGGANTGTGGQIYGTMEGGNALIMVGNGPNGIRLPLFSQFRRSTFIAHEWSRPMELPSNPVPVDEVFGAKVSGRYQDAWGGAFTVSLREGGLQADGFRGPEPTDLIQVRENSFAVAEFASEISFLTNPDDGKRYMALVRRGTDEIIYANLALWTPDVMPEEVLLEGDFDAALGAYRELMEINLTDPACSENSLNALGYKKMGSGEAEAAILTFRVYAALYPDSANAYDSLGESYMNAGEVELAIANYERSLELNPKNQGAVKMLEKLRQP